jgi:hypothetical protein
LQMRLTFVHCSEHASGFNNVFSTCFFPEFKQMDE